MRPRKKHEATTWRNNHGSTIGLSRFVNCDGWFKHISFLVASDFGFIFEGGPSGHSFNVKGSSAIARVKPSAR
jgi:hypothetical protein